MEKQVTTPKMLRQRRFLLVAPLLVLPFLTMIFWALGGGKMKKVDAQATTNKGFNIHLPDANLKDEKQMDKMSYYDQAHLDSVKFLELVKNDPNYKNIPIPDSDEYLTDETDTLPFLPNSRGLNTSLYSNRGHNDPNTDKIYRKLAELDQEMNKPAATSIQDDPYSMYLPTSGKRNASVTSSDVDRLEQMMQAMDQPTGEDPEMAQLNGMLDKILDVQYPERAQEKFRQASKANRGQVFAVSASQKDNSITFLDTGDVEARPVNGFYSLSGAIAEETVQNAIQAVIHETQTLVDGATVKLRLLNDVFINGIHISKGNFLFGVASLRGERLSIKINSIRHHNSLFPVDLSVYDMDGLQGIYIPGAIARDVAKQSADRSMQSIGLASLDGSWQAQAATAGIETAKTLFSRKVKLIKVTVKAGYHVLLRDEKQKQAD